MMRRPCKACGVPLRFVRGMGGELIPLDEQAKVYTITQDSSGDDVAIRMAGGFVSHFSTCPKASEFSKKAVKS